METVILLATDFDGTVAPIQEDPARVQIDERVRSFFESVDRRPGIELAFLSGRELSDLRARTEGIRAWRAGSHGLEIQDTDDRLIREPSARFPDLDAALRKSLVDRGFRLEPKRYGLAIHWRGAAVEDEEDAILRFTNWADAHRLKVTLGRKVIEASVAGGGKANALAEIIERSSPSLASFAGDDLTDFEALEMIAARGWPAFFLQSSERPEIPPGAKVISSREELLVEWRALVRGSGAFDDVRSR